MLNFLTRRAPRAPEQKSLTGFLALMRGTSATWTARDYPTLAREGVMQNAVAYRCVRMIAEGAASVPFLLYEGATELESHPLLSLLSAPNPQDSGTRCSNAGTPSCNARAMPISKPPRYAARCANCMCCAQTA